MLYWRHENGLRWKYATEYHRNDKGQFMTFDDKPYQRQIFADQSQVIVLRKCVQVVGTEWAIIETLSSCELGRNVFYVLPKYGLRNQFVQNRVFRSIERVPYYKEMIRSAVGRSESVAMYHFGEGTAYFASSETRSDFDAFNADIAIIDDYQSCDLDNVALTDDRLSASPLKAKRLIGIAEYPETGIDIEFLKSDQKYWHIKCECCGEWQVLDLFENVVVEIDEGKYELLDTNWQPEAGNDPSVCCNSCHQPMNRLDPDGEWVETQKSNISGYALSKLFVPTASIRELWQKLELGQSNESVMQNLMNRDLGTPYVGKAGFKLTDAILDACKADYRMPQTSIGICTMGVDVGTVLNVKISEWVEGRRKAIHIDTVPSFEALDDLFDRYNIVCCVIDCFPEVKKAVEFQISKENSVVWLCQYPTMSIEKQVDGILLDREAFIVKVDRTQSLDEMVASYRNQQTILPVNAASLPDFYKQMTASQRVYDENKQRYNWIHTSPDHYFHADNYDMIAWRIMGEVAPLSGLGSEVSTLTGWF